MSYYKGSGYGGSRGYRGGSSSYRGGSSGGGGSSESWRGGRGGSSFSSTRPIGGSSGGGSSRYYTSSPPSSYESRSRSSYVGGTSGTDRYSSSRRDDAYGRYPDMSSYGSRDYGRGASPEPPRKRVRGDSPTYMGGRRSHERSFTASGGGDYPSSRVGGGSGGFYDKGNSGGAPGGGYLSEKGTYREVRESRPPHHAPPSTNDYPAFRKPSFSSPRGGGGFRASRRGLRASRGAGTAFRHSSSATYLSRKRLAADSAYHLRRRGLTTRTSYLRRLKQLRLFKRYSRASERRKRLAEEGEDREKDDEKDGEEPDEEEEEDEDDDEEVIEVGSSQEDGEDDDVDEEAGPDEEVKEEASKESVEMEEGEVEGGEDEGKEKEPEEKITESEVEKDSKDKEAKESSKEGTASLKKEVKKKKVAVKKTSKKSKTAGSPEAKEAKKSEAKEESDGDEKDGEKKPALTNFLGQPYIKLKCPHCHFDCVTFKEYSRHLGNAKHLAAISNLSAKLRKSFVTMRLEQRKMQQVLDEEAKTLNMRLRTVFCSVCKLNYRTLRSQHQNSASHKKMREFQSPYCRVCRIGFKSSWAYEVHLCELQHIKRKARIERLSNPPGAKDLDDDINLDTNSFMVLDAVGSGDDSEGEKSNNEAVDDKADGTKEKGKEGTKEKKKKEKKEIKLGSEFCKLMEVYFCELCKIYLPRLDVKERALTVHCRSRTHLQRYIRSRDDRNLRRKAVKLHREREKQKEKEKEKKSTGKDDSTAKDGDNSTTDKVEGSENKGTKDIDSTKGESEDKIWSEVDKDLSCLLNEEEEVKNSDDDDDEESKEGERYDRFKHSEKDGVNNSGTGAKSKEEGSIDSTVTEKSSPVKGKGGNVAKDATGASNEPVNTANGNITSAEKKKIEVSE